MENAVKNFFTIRPPNSYEESHEPRLDFLIKDLDLDKLENQRIGDFGCGFGRLLAKLPQNKGNEYYGFDGADIHGSPYLQCFNFHHTDLNLPFYEDNPLTLDTAFCFELLEHLEAPYRCVFEIKRYLKPGGILYCSVPAEDSLHPMIYPALFIPKENFMQFMGQMAFQLIRYTRHTAAFSQNVFVYKNLDWTHAKMLFPKSESKFHGQPPHVQCNL